MNYEADYFAKKYAKDNDKILFAFYRTDNYDETVRFFHLYDYVDYDNFCEFFIEIVKEASSYPYSEGGKYEFYDIGKEKEIIITDNLLSQIKIFNLDDNFEKKHLDHFIDVILKNNF